jgi:hypothetical protein
MSSMKKRIVVIVPIFSAGLSFVGSAYGVAEPICKFSMLKPTCGSMGWGGVASPDEQAAWERLSKRQPTCQDLAQFRDKFPDGVYANRIARAYATPIGERVEKRIEAQPTAFEHSIYEGSLADGRATALTEVAARDFASRGAFKQAEQSCQRAAKISKGTLASFELRDMQWKCIAVGNGSSCGLRATAVCNVRQGIERTVKVCGKP